jgi:hypothetical protein
MIVLQVEHKIANFEGWKKAFDNDPIDRKRSGVKRYQISRPADDPHYVIIDLYFDNLEDAEKTLEALQILWKKVEGTVMVNPVTRLLNVIDIIEL